MVSLSEISRGKGQYGVGLSSRDWSEGDPRYVRITDIDDDGQLGGTKVAPDGSKIDWEKALLKPGDLLFARSGATVGKTYLHSDCNDPAVYAGYLIRFELDRDRAVPNYVFRYTQSPDYRRWVENSQRAVAQPNINAQKYGALAIPLPPIEEQRRIAAILDHADTLRAKRREALARLDDLGDSVYAEMFADPICNVRQVRLDEVSEIASGITKGRKVTGAPLREIPYLAVANVQDKKLDLVAVKTIEATDAEIARWRLQQDDLLLTEGGDPDKLGRGSLWREELPEAIHQNHVFRVRPDTDQVNPTYLNWTIGSRRGKAYFLRAAKQTTGIASINSTQLKAFPLELPPKDVQDRFAQRVRAIDSMRDQHRAALAELDSLFASLQSRAFRGEL